MNNKEKSELKEVCVALEAVLQKYDGGLFNAQIKALNDIVNCLNSDLNEKDTTKFIRSRYRALYPPHGGLREFYIDHEDLESRLKLNEPLDALKDKLWSIIKKYV